MQKVLFLQLPPPRFDFCETPTNIPLAAGFVISALKHELARDQSLHDRVEINLLGNSKVDIFGDQGLISAINDAQPDILCLTLYLWNVQRSLFIASMVKRQIPGIQTVVGGPEVTPDNDWVLNHPAVNVGVFGEGESRILSVLVNMGRMDRLRNIPGICYKDSSELIINGQQPELWDLDKCDYPYLDGCPEVKSSQTAFIETARGCPFKCRYCFYHKSFNSVRLHSDSRLNRLFEFIYSDACEVSEVYLMDPTFNARRGFRSILGFLSGLRARKDIRLHTELRSDLLSEFDVDLFREAGLASAEIGLQSTNAEALRKANRKGNVEATLRGAGMLKQRGIEVTTGIILGLPGDTPEGFRKTLDDLKTSGAYSVIHPFVLSALPGTDFRLRARKLGLQHQDRPPYHVYQTPGFPEEAFRECLIEFETEFETELDHINPPSMVSSPTWGPDSLDDEPYVSKWIIQIPQSIPERLVESVARKSTDPFSLWFAGNIHGPGEKQVIDVLRIFGAANPYTSLHLILESETPVTLSMLDEMIGILGQPGLYLNRYYQPLYEENEVISPCIWILAPDPGDHNIRDSFVENYGKFARIVWKMKEIDVTKCENTQTPLLIDHVTNMSIQKLNKLFNKLKRIHDNSLEEVLFSSGLVQALWDSRIRGLNSKYRITEKILRS